MGRSGELEDAEAAAAAAAATPKCLEKKSTLPKKSMKFESTVCFTMKLIFWGT